MEFYLVGIKGTGMSALANILVDLGHNVRGIDYPKKYFTEDSFRDSIVCESFDDFSLSKAYFYVIGNAFKLSNFTKKIIDSGYNFMYYTEFLESFFMMKKIGICGSHGKTTTTCFASKLIDEPLNVLIGDGSGYGDENAECFLFEACEYQNNFLAFSFKEPKYIITAQSFITGMANSLTISFSMLLYKSNNSALEPDISRP